MLVIDASMALAWAFERQQPEDGQRARRLLSDCGSHPWWVPALWPLEVANAFLVSERRGVIASSGSDLFRARLQALPIETDATRLQESEPRILAIARAQGLSQRRRHRSGTRSAPWRQPDQFRPAARRGGTTAGPGSGAWKRGGPAPG